MRPRHHRQTAQESGSLLVSFDPDDPIDLLLDDLRTVGLEIASLLRDSDALRSQSTGARLDWCRRASMEKSDTTL